MRHERILNLHKSTWKQVFFFCFFKRRKEDQVGHLGGNQKEWETDATDEYERTSSWKLGDGKLM